MLLRMYSIFDSASAAYTRPFFFVSDGQAIRAFADMADDRGHEVGRHPEDYSLFRIGAFYDTNAEIVPETPVVVGKAWELTSRQGSKFDQLDAEAERHLPEKGVCEEDV